VFVASERSVARTQTLDVSAFGARGSVSPERTAAVNTSADWAGGVSRGADRDERQEGRSPETRAGGGICMHYSC